MRGLQITFDDLIAEVNPTLRLRAQDLLDSVVFQNERAIDTAANDVALATLTAGVATLTAGVATLTAGVAALDARVTALENPSAATSSSAIGELYGSSGTITVTTAGTYYGWTDATEGNISSTGYVTSNVGHAIADQLIIGEGGAGTYQVTCAISFSGSLNATITGRIYVSGVAEPSLMFVRKLGTGGDTGSASLSGIASLERSDTVDFRITADGNGKTITIEAINLLIHRMDS